VILPFQFENQVSGVVELGTLEKLSKLQIELLEQAAEAIGIAVNTAQSRARQQLLLVRTEALAEELQVQQEELRQTNEELEEQKNEMESLNEELQAQQEELRQSNEELEEQTELLTQEKERVELRNREIQATKRALEDKAQQLELTSKYKSEFLANMSHELRTPLSSVLILAKLLERNKDQNLTPKQAEYASIIHSSGSDLLELINEILDLSKIESGKMKLNVLEVPFEGLAGQVERTFSEVAKNKSLNFDTKIDPGLVGKVLETDEARLLQVVKNLVSNAFKFTHEGGVELSVRSAASGWSTGHPTLEKAQTVVAIAVTDTGIGVAPEDQARVFEAFQQAEGGTGREYGGTGLGLSISREITQILGGDLKLESAVGEGSTFTIYLPSRYTPPAAASETPAQVLARMVRPHAAQVPAPTEVAPVEDILNGKPDLDAAEVPDDRAEIQASDRVLLIIEDDVNFARILLDLARQRGFKGIVATTGETGLALAMRHRPDAITLDVELPDVLGWIILDRLKHEPTTRHIPVHIISVDEHWQRSAKLGAVAHIQKPVDVDRLT